ncbi:MAG: hypothetical protein ACMG57_05100 [Candidatus Dojkabacteria bacterium]
MKILIVDDDHDVDTTFRFILEGKYSIDDIVFFDNSIKLFEALPGMDLSEVEAVFLDHTIMGPAAEHGQGDEVFKALIQKDSNLESKIYSTSSDLTTVDYVDELHKIGKPPMYNEVREFSRQNFLKGFRRQFERYMGMVNLPENRMDIA